MLPEDDAHLEAVIERQRNSQSPRGRRWISAIILLKQFEKQPVPADLFADTGSDILPLIGRHLARAHEWVNRDEQGGYDRH